MFPDGFMLRMVPQVRLSSEIEHFFGRGRKSSPGSSFSRGSAAGGDLPDFDNFGAQTIGIRSGSGFLHSKVSVCDSFII